MLLTLFGKGENQMISNQGPIFLPPHLWQAEKHITPKRGDFDEFI